jgi:hypothetical protein
MEGSRAIRHFFSIDRFSSSKLDEVTRNHPYTGMRKLQRAVPLRLNPQLVLPSLLGLAVSGAALSFSCSGNEAMDARLRPSGGSGGSGQFGAGGTAGGLTLPDAARGDLAVTLTPNAPVVCAGHCVDLLASVANGTAPYTYSWTPALDATAGPHHVCPTATTTYSVQVTDSSGARSGEVQRSNLSGTASVTVSVTNDCTDAGEPRTDASVPPDGGPPPPDAPPGSTHEICSVRWKVGPNALGSTSGVWYDGWWRGSSPVATDPAGNIIVTGGFVGTIDFGGGPLRSPGNESAAFVVKLDPSCRHVWSRMYSGAFARVWAGSIGTDSASNVIVAGAFLGGIDFGAGTLFSTPGVDSIFVAKLDPGGRTIWSRAYGGALNVQNWVHDLAVDGAGSMYLTGYAATDTNFGAGPLPSAGGTQLPFFVKLDSSGGFVRGRFLPIASYHVSLDVSSAGEVVFTGGSQGNDIDWGNGVTLSGSEGFRYAVKFDAAGTALWATKLDSVNHVDHFLWGSNVVLDRSGNAFVLSGWRYDPATGGPLPEVLIRLAPSGTQSWKTEIPGTMDERWNGGAATNRAGEVIILADFAEPISWGGVTFSPIGGTDLALVKLSAAGNHVWSTTFATTNEEQPAGIATDKDDNVVFAGVTLRSDGSELFVVKTSP